MQKVFECRFRNTSAITLINLVMGCYPAEEQSSTERTAQKLALKVLTTYGEVFPPSVLAAASLQLALSAQEEKENVAEGHPNGTQGASATGSMKA